MGISSTPLRRPTVHEHNCARSRRAQSRCRAGGDGGAAVTSGGAAARHSSCRLRRLNGRGGGGGAAGGPCRTAALTLRVRRRADTEKGRSLGQ